MTHTDGKTEDSLYFPYSQILSHLDPIQRKELTRLKKRIKLERDSYLVKKGEKPDRIFVNRRGAFETVHERAFPRIESLSAADKPVFGLVEMFSESGFEFSIVSTSDCEFEFLEKDDLIKFLRHHPRLIDCLSGGLSYLYQEAIQKLRDQ